jgi:hypothetical protein
VNVVDPDFAITVAGELKAALAGTDAIALKVPDATATSEMLNDLETIQEMTAWFAQASHSPGWIPWVGSFM